MDIVEQIVEHDVVDWDFMFAGGAKLAITLDSTAGDFCEALEDRYVLTTVDKPSLTTPDEIVAGEVIQVFKQHLAVVATCSRKQRQPSEEEKFNMQKTLHALAKGLQ